MKIGIHHTPGSFSERWISYCQKKHIEYKIVNAYDKNIINLLNDCDIFIWNHLQNKYKDVLFAKQLLFSLSIAGKRVFPDFNTCWHYDDKIGQKYLLEAINAPMVPSYIFYDKVEALNWLKKTNFPKVWKLSRGAGSANVRLVKNKYIAKQLIKKAFSSGFSQYNRWAAIKERYYLFYKNKRGIFWLIKGLAYFFIVTEFAKMHPKEKGYIYFQEFIPNNLFDIRVIVIGNKAFALKRLVRKNDFRASGSGNIKYNRNEIDERCIKIAFEVNKNIQAQCIAYDFIFDSIGNPLILEISYGFSVQAYDKCEGYWDSNLKWHDVSFNPQEWILENLITENS
jgi:glutathione synthase/RimK-type ligase-like ATP-grasp enzyme